MSKNPDTLFLSEESIRKLVPARLPARLHERYKGGAFYGRLDRDFGEDEQETIRTIYQSVGELMELTAKRDASEEENSLAASALKKFAVNCPILVAGGELEKYEQAARETQDTKLTTLFRELADGPFASLYGILFLVGSAGVEPEYFQTLFYLARDQRKIMRSLIIDLDPVGRDKDELEKLHSVDLLLQKWQKTVYRAFDAEMEVAFKTSFTGAVAERCIEFAEVDRVFYHLVNNAIHHGEGKLLAIQVVESEDGSDLIWMFSNPISKKKASDLGNTSGRVFEYGVGSGSGVGLASLAESVSHAYGIETTEELISSGYAGSIVEGEVFRLWFHWPRTAEA
ncbi:MAG: hypothetical protein AAGJ81_05355 [Verrucomicrobiota bacterium]